MALVDNYRAQNNVTTKLNVLKKLEVTDFAQELQGKKNVCMYMYIICCCYSLYSLHISIVIIVCTPCFNLMS